MKSKEWEYLIDLLCDLVSHPDIGAATRLKLKKLINYVSKM